MEEGLKALGLGRCSWEPGSWLPSRAAEGGEVKGETVQDVRAGCNMASMADGQGVITLLQSS